MGELKEKPPTGNVKYRRQSYTYTQTRRTARLRAVCPCRDSALFYARIKYMIGTANIV